MDLIINHIHIPVEKDGFAEYTRVVAQKLEIEERDTSILKILSKSLEISNKEQFFYKVSFVIKVPDDFENRDQYPIYTARIEEDRVITPLKERPIIVGFGPAGMFAALEFIANGISPVIFERGKKIEERSMDVQKFIEERAINPESNVQFGEGGAGSFSDGKLFSRRNSNSSYVNKVLKTFIKFGAPEDIEFISKPHLGTDVLCEIVGNIRSYIITRGGEIHYCSKMTDILISNGIASGIVINGEKEYFSSSLFIAVGHSARDTFEMIHEKGVFIEPKPISIGVRIEHPVETINLMRYGKKYKDNPGLGAATYSLNYTNRKNRRGVYTFCMCPGGEVVNASSNDGLMVVNGMSYSHRSSPYSNSALVVPCHVEDYKASGPLAGIELQKDIERKSFAVGGGMWNVPAQNLMDFLGEKVSDELNENSYKQGAVSVDLRKILPEFIVQELSAALHKWKGEVPLFVSESGILLGAETRTSSPVQIKRNEQFESVNVKNLYPVGEGSGYTGGITSSATDAIKAVEMLLFGR